MKRMTAFVVCCLLASGCWSTGRTAEGDKDVPSPRNLASTVPPGIVRTEELTELMAQTAEREQRVSDTVSVPPKPKPVEAAKQEPPAAPPHQETRAKPKPNAKPKAPPKAPAVSAQQSQSSSGRKLSLSELRAKYPDWFKVSGAAKEPRVALTFDDGPDLRFTPQVLDILKASGVKATFFLLGKKAEEHPDIVKRIVREGHVIGNHSYRHPQFTKLTVEQFASEIEQAEEVLNRLAGYRPKLVRPPYGAIDEGELQWAKDRGYIIVNWNVDSLDWKNLGEQQVAGNILGHTKAGAIVLQHSAGGDSQDLSGTVKALPGIIAKLREQGYSLVTVPELLKLPKNK